MAAPIEGRRLPGKVAVVTGAWGGVGTATCDALVRDGAKVLRVDVTGEDCLLLDVGSDDGNRQMIEAAMELYGRLDVLVLNAGDQFMAPIHEFPLAEWDRLMNIMVRGPFLAMKYAWEPLTRQPGGRIIVTASGASIVAEQFKAAYIAAKHAVAGLVKVAALEGGPSGLTANAVAPGWMFTGLIERQMEAQERLHGLSRDEIVAGWLSRSPAGRGVETSEVAEVIAFLASRQSDGISGTLIPVDLGMLVG